MSGDGHESPRPVAMTARPNEIAMPASVVNLAGRSHDRDRLARKVLQRRRRDDRERRARTLAAQERAS